jgi:hypothetical protein
MNDDHAPLALLVLLLLPVVGLVLEDWHLFVVLVVVFLFVVDLVVILVGRRLGVVHGSLLFAFPLYCEELHLLYHPCMFQINVVPV